MIMMLRTTLARMATETMQAGLKGERMPDFGRVACDQLRVLNSIYEEARNQCAARTKTGHRP